VIAAPLAAREAWRDWVGRTFDLPLYCLQGRLPVDETTDGRYPAYFCHYDILAAHSAFFQRQKVGTLVLDEVHMLQSKASQRMQAVSAVAPFAQRILQLTGTPVWNKPRSLYPFLHIMSPGAWGTAFVFKKRYCDAQPGAHGWTYDGISNAEELRARLDTVMVRRTWADVMPDLPPTTRVLEPVGLTGAQLIALEADAMRATLAMRDGGSEGAYLARMRRKIAALKIAPSVEAARQAAADGHKVVLWAWHNEIADKLEQVLSDLGDVYRLRSADNPNLRDFNVAEFRAHDGPAFMVASMGVGGVGLDLSCSDYAIFVELDWTPANNQQAEMRTFHMDRPHVVVVFYTDDPVESRLIEALDVKNGFAAALGLGSDEIMRKVLV
jgi:SNF2 family DNA or RNA helicase